jgi:hypothetical protein
MVRPDRQCQSPKSRIGSHFILQLREKHSGSIGVEGGKLRASFEQAEAKLGQSNVNYEIWVAMKADTALIEGPTRRSCSLRPSPQDPHSRLHSPNTGKGRKAMYQQTNCRSLLCKQRRFRTQRSLKLLSSRTQMCIQLKTSSEMKLAERGRRLLRQKEDICLLTLILTCHTDMHRSMVESWSGQYFILLVHASPKAPLNDPYSMIQPSPIRHNQSQKSKSPP